MDFVARDRRGRIVRDLLRDEVRVFEDKVPQHIRSFAFFDNSPAARALAGVAESVPAGEGERRIQELRNVNFVTTLLVGPIAALSDNGVAARDLLLDALTAEMHPDTYVGVLTVDHGVLRVILPYTNDPAEIARTMARRLKPKQAAALARQPASAIIRAAADRIIVRLMGSVQPTTQGLGDSTTAQRAGEPPADPVRPDEDTARTPFSIFRLLQALAEMPGRKVLFYIAEGLRVDPDRREWLTAVISTANRSGVTIYCVDLTRLDTRSELASARATLDAAVNASREEQESDPSAPVPKRRILLFDTARASILANSRLNLQTLAEETSGKLIGRTNDLRTPVRRAMEEVRTHHELTYVPSELRLDGRFRRLQIVSTRPGVTITARSGYFALPMLNGEQVWPWEYGPLMALNRQPPPRDVDFHVAALRFRPGPEAQHAAVFEAPLRNASVVDDENKGVKASLSFLALVKDVSGLVVTRVSRDLVYRERSESELRSGVATFASPLRIPPGRYTLESAVVDRNSGKSGTRRSSLGVESSSGLMLSDLSLVRRVEPSPGPADGSDPLLIRTGRVIPDLTGTAKAGTDLAFFATVYPDARLQAPVAIVLDLLRDGRRVASREYLRTERREADPILAVFPSRDLTLGQYEARLTVRQGAMTREQLLPFTLIP